LINYLRDKELNKLLQGKKVALVGPSPHLIDKSIGEIIDSYDIVCRVNEIHPTGFEADYGNRTDVVFHNCGTRFIEVFGQRLIEKAFISKYLKYVICPAAKATGTDNFVIWPPDFESPVVQNFNKINVFNTPFHWLGVENYKLIYNLFGCEPNAGQTAILFLLLHQVEELFITGFSFYQQGNTPAESHRPGHTNKGLESEMIGDLGHPQAPQIDCFKNKIYPAYKDKIVLDSFLNEILSLNHKNVLDLT
jgi:hypothetical protein